MRQSGSTRHQFSFGQPPRLVVAGPDAADFTVTDQLVECTERLFDRGTGIFSVRKIDIDVIGAQPPQALFAFGYDHVCAQTARHVPVGEAHFRSNHEAVTRTVLQPPTDHPFAFAAAESFDPRGILVGRIEEITSTVGIGIQQCERSIHRHLAAEIHGSEAITADLQFGRRNFDASHKEEFMKIYTPIEKFSHKDIKSIGETKPPQMCKRSRKSQKKAIFTHLIFLT